MLLHERGREKDIIDQSVLGELVNQQKTARFQQEYIVLPKLMLVDVDCCARCTSNKDGIYATLNLTRETAVLIQHFSAGVANQIVHGAIQQGDILLFIHSHQSFLTRKYCLFPSAKIQKLFHILSIVVKKIHFFIRKSVFFYDNSLIFAYVSPNFHLCGYASRLVGFIGFREVKS